jgi:hypothetical protein
MGEPLRLRSAGSGLWVARRVPQRIAATVLALSAPVLIALLAVSWAPGFLVFLLLHVLTWVYLSYLRASISGTVVIDDVHVRCGKERIERARIRHGYVAPATTKEQAGVVLLDAGEKVLGRVGVASLEDGDRVLERLRLAPHQATASFAGLAPAGTRGATVSALVFLLGVAVTVLGIPLHLGALVGVGVTLAAISQIVLASCRYRVGADGILIVDRIGRRFVPWREVEAVEPTPRGIAVRLRKGRWIAMPLVRGNPGRERVAGEQPAFFTRAREAFDAFQSGATPDVAVRVARGGRTRGVWLAALAGETGEGGFRKAPIAPEDLLRVVESAAADDSARAGAAFVLGRTGSEADRARLRVAAEACASPRLRVVLEKAADASPAAEVEEALGGVEEDDERSVAGLS